MTVIKSASVRRAASYIIPFFLIPAIVITGMLVFREKSRIFLMVSVSALTLFLFICGFEQRKTGSRRLILTAVFIALASIGRAVCSPLPGVNPVTAITVLCAVYLGGEAGFMTGAFTALISNIFSGQGTWTPFQMLAWGLIGMTAGLLSRFLLSGNSRLRLCVYTFAAGAAYSLIMDVFTVIWANNAFIPKAYAAALLTALPFTAVYCISNIIFTYLLAKPFGEKLGRIKIKYGI